MLVKYEELYQCFNRNSCGIIAKADDWIILKGSRIAANDTCSYAKTGRIQRLIEDGYIQNNIFVKDYPIKSKTAGVTIIGRHGVSSVDAEKKSCLVSVDEAKEILKNNVNVNIGLNTNCNNNISTFDKTHTTNKKLGFDVYEKLITDATFQMIKHLQKDINIFSIVGQTHTEHWHSSFFKWLFDPKSSLGLGSFALERLLYLYILKREDGCICYEDIDNLALNEIEFVNEKVISNTDFQGWTRGSIDVYGESEELIIVMENKVTVKEEFRYGVGQTQLYYDYIEKHKNEGQKSIYIFITPDPNQHPYCQEYIHITYQEVYDLVIEKCLANPELKQAGKYVLEQYSNNLSMPYKKDNKKYPMALIHIPFCGKIYEEHSEALDVIFKSVETKDINSLEYSVYKKHKEVFDEIYMSIDKFGRTPDFEMERKFITFDNLVCDGKLQENTVLYMNYDGVTHYAKIIKNIRLNEYCMALLDENMNLYVDDQGELLEEYSGYRTPSQAAGDAVYLYRTRNNDFREKPSLNGRNYWVIKDKNIKLNEIMK